VIVITGYATVATAVAAMQQGAYHYLAKPFQNEEVRLLVQKALEKRGLRLQVAELQRQVEAQQGYQPLIGKNPKIIALHEMIRQIAPTDCNVLILGETGTGKELVARAIHHLSPRAGKRFLAINCGAFSEELLASELFGHEAGAFTGARGTKKGLLEVATGGTFFLDEVGDMPLSMQVKLLRVIQDHRVMRVGGTAPVPVSFKLVCATHRDLRDLVRSGRFREDLFFRINVIQLRIPPLRERPEDILWFARRFLLECAAAHEVPRFTLSAAAEAALLAYPWPGNLRELRHCIERACILSTSPVLEPAVLFEDGAPPPRDEGAGGSLASYLAACERRYIESVLRQSGGQVGKAAARLGISRKNLWEKVRKLGLRQARAGPS